MANEQQRDPEYEKRRREARRRRRARQRKIDMIKRAVLLGILVVIMLVLIVAAVKLLKKDKTSSGSTADSVIENADDSSGTVSDESSPESEASAVVGDPSAPAGSRDEVLASASKMAAQYDYDGAIAKLQSYSDQSDADVSKMIVDYTAVKDTCTAADINTVPHIFFHSLINDSRGLTVSDQVSEGRVVANNAAMATVDEFNHVISQMYEAGFVLISLDDMVITNEDGSFSPNTSLMLPPGKKPFLLSEDDLSYYHSYGENGVQGYADRLVIDENGKVKCEYTDPNGQKQIGDYDMVPLIDSFIEAHPDFAYHDARPTVALTGYNGIFGYVTNDYYTEGVNSEHLGESQKNWLAAHPEYNYEQDCAEAKKIADAMKATGWTFASHTYGHLDANTSSLESLMADQDRWQKAVGDIIGPTDKIIFAFGADIGGAGNYTDDNPKYDFFKSKGYKFFCNCDGTWGWTQITSSYVRTGRFAVDGFTLYQAITPDGSSYARCSSNYANMGVHDIATWFDPNRTTPITGE